MPEPVIEAAGGVLWRTALGGPGVEVALVHRPKYDDWSLPKGKLNPAEHVVVAAVREVLEETGHRTVVGRPLGETRYRKDGRPKRVRYWALRHAGGGFQPSAEVDRMAWVPAREGHLHLAPDRDRDVLVRFAEETVDTWPCVLMPHAGAGERSAGPAADRERTLDDVGVAQADALVPVLSAFGVRRVLSADVLRCLQTVAPFADDARLTVESEPLVSETGYAADPPAAADRIVSVLQSREPWVVCSQGKALPDLIAAVCKAFGHPPPADTSMREAGMVVLHAAQDDLGQVRLVAVDRFDPPAVPVP